jgi:peptide/nickel transport system permease protein
VAELCRRKPLGAVGLAIILLLAVVAAIAGWVAPHDPTAMNVGARLKPPFSPDHVLGTDKFGRDLLSRLLLGSRVSLYVGFTSVALGSAIGGALGVASGYFRGRLDMVVQRVIDVLLAFPMILLALAVVAAVGPSTHNVVIAIAVPIIPRIARVVRATVLSLRETDFVAAATAMGAGDVEIMVRHLVPNTMPVIIVVGSVQLGVAIVTEASLSYLGLGVQEPQPSWGLMLSGAVGDYARAAPWVPVIPGVALALAVLALNLLGDALRDVLDPRLQQA